MVIVNRTTTPTIEPQEVLRPRAAPVDSYVRPPDPAPSDLHNLARGLENFSRDIKGMLTTRQAHDEEAARLRGEAQFFKDNQIGYAEAVRQGRVPAFASRPFMEAYKEAEGKVVGARLASQMQLEYQGWEGRNDQDPANFDQFMTDFLKRNLTQDDPDVLRGAMPYIYTTVNAGYTQRTQDAADAAYSGGFNANIAVSSMVIDDASIAGLTSGQGTDYAGLWEELVELRGHALGSGFRTHDYDTKLIDLIAAKAMEERDPALLELLDRSLPGSDTPMSASPYGREVRAKTIDALATINYQAENFAYTEQTRRDASLKDALTAFAIETITSNPEAALPDNFWTAFEKVEPEARLKVQNWRNAVLGGQEEDRTAIRDLNYRILVKGENAMEVIEEGVSSGAIRKASTLQSMYELGQEDPAWQRTQSYQLGLKAIQQAAALMVKRGEDTAEVHFDPEYISVAATAASLDFELSMRAWAKSPEGIAALQANDRAAIALAVARYQKFIIDGFIPTPDTPAEYVQPQIITDTLRAAGYAPNPLAPNDAKVAADRATREAFEASPQGQMPEWVDSAPPDLTALPEAEQRAVREEADRLGIDPPILLEETYRQVEELLRGEVN